VLISDIIYVVFFTVSLIHLGTLVAISCDTLQMTVSSLDYNIRKFSIFSWVIWL